MKNWELYELKKAIEGVKNKGNNRFKLPLLLNEKIIEERIATLETLRKPSEKYNTYLQEKRALITKHGELDESGQIILYSEPNGQGVRRYDFGLPNIIKCVDEYNEKLEVLDKKNKAVIDAEAKKQEEFEKTLEEEANVELKKIPFDEIPELDYEQLKKLFPIVVV